MIWFLSYPGKKYYNAVVNIIKIKCKVYLQVKNYWRQVPLK